MIDNQADYYRAISRIDAAIQQLRPKDRRKRGRISNLVLSHSIEDMEAAVSGLEKGELGAHFMRMQNELSPNKFMWLAAIDQEGKPIAVTAVRLDDIGLDWSLKRFLMERMRRLVPSKTGGVAELDASTSEFANNIFGRCVYMGDTFVHRDWRDNCLSTYMTHYLALVAWKEWCPSIIYGWVRKYQADDGLARKWGFTETYGPGMIWKSEPLDPDWIDTCFVGMRRDAIALLVLNTLKELPSHPSSSSEGM